MSSSPTKIGKYEVIETIGRGGMGLVYRALDRQLSREVAIKTVTEGFAGDKEMLARFYREAAKTGALKHPNIVIVYDLGEQDGFPYIVMEYLSGDPLDRLIRSQRPLSLGFKVNIIQQVCSALGYAHRNDVIHRDVKPGNVIVQQDGVAKLLDFGIATQESFDGRLTRTGHVIGTVQYMAPERLQNQAFDGRSDVFSTGILLFQLLTGQLPFLGEDYGVVQRILSEKHPPLHKYLQQYPSELDSILDKALAKDPKNRYSSADEMADDLGAVGEQLKREQVSELLSRAQRLSAAGEQTSARDTLIQLLRLDPQNNPARELLTKVQKNLSRQHRADKLRQLQAAAEEWLKEKRYEEAIGQLEEALKLEPSSTELSEMLRTAQQKKRIREQIEARLREADNALESGDLKSAEGIIAEDMEIEEEDTRIRAAYSALVRRIGERQRQVRLNSLLAAARRELDSRRFTAALKILGEAEQVDPTDPALISLLSTAKIAREQEERKRVVEELQVQIAAAVSLDQLRNAAKCVEDALARLPAEPLLLKFKVQLGARIRDAELRKHVDGVVQRCLPLIESSPREAAEIIAAELKKYPGDKRLLSLQTDVENHLSRWTLEKARASYLTRAREALDRGEFSEAVRLLQNCQAEGIFSEEIKELLDLGRHELDSQQRAQDKEKLLFAGQELISKGDYHSAVQLLSGMLPDGDDSAIKALRDKASNLLQAQTANLQSALRQVTGFVEADQFEEALAFSEMQPAAVQENPALQQLLLAVQDARERHEFALNKISFAYSALARTELRRAWTSMAEAGSGCRSELMTRMFSLFQDRCQSIADRKLQEAMARAEITTEDPKRALEEVASVSPLAAYANRETKAKWRASLRRLKFTNALGHIGLGSKGSRL